MKPSRYWTWGMATMPNSELKAKALQKANSVAQPFG